MVVRLACAASVAESAAGPAERVWSSGFLGKVRDDQLRAGALYITSLLMPPRGSAMGTPADGAVAANV